MIIKLSPLQSLYSNLKTVKTPVKHHPLTRKEKIQSDRLLMMALFALIMVTCILYNIL